MSRASATAPAGARELRNALSCFGTGVTVVTTRGPDGRCVGVTANSFTSVSLEPPIVLWSLSARSPNLAAYSESGRFVINVLALDQVNLSRAFSRPVEDRFAGVDWSPGLGGMPVLAGCAATIECSVLKAQEAGDHVIFLGGVERFAYERTPPLLFCHGSYAKAVELTAA